MSDLPVLIFGARVFGLVLVRRSRKKALHFLIFDRDEHIDARKQGWGLTIHSALPVLENCLPSELFDRLKTVQVDPEQGRNDTGQFIFLNLANAEAMFQIPPAQRLRILKREVQEVPPIWDRCPMKDVVDVKSEDGSKSQGRLVVGCDGATSNLRKMLCPETGGLNQLPIRYLGVTGCHPDTGNYLWFTTLDTPGFNGSQGADEYYTAQINISWLVRDSEAKVPANADRLNKMKLLANGFERKLETTMHNIPENTEVTEEKLADYRGEAANHGITDVQLLCERLFKVTIGESSQKEPINHCEAGMRERGSWAIIKSRQACLHAHDFKSVNKDSAILARSCQVLIYQLGMRVMPVAVNAENNY
ncbi:related to monooxygenase [Rhynchosporium graminicola]|uniref:Related to monooxygenase n=1 Tax=Rhynchosporium graminicola TaxID=2792576 RepID=A0A1E1KHC0_9HELO|nr:related to monooxygenase [Rhynchosporium commune]